MEPSGPPLLVQIQDGGAYNGGVVTPSQAGELPFEPLRKRHVVAVEAGRVPAARPVESPVERSRQARLFVVCHHQEARILNRGKQRGRSVRGGVVHHDQLEIRRRLAQHALDGRTEEACLVVDGKKDGDERH